MATSGLAVVVTIRWWVPVYIETLIFFCKTFRTMPDFDKVTRVLERGIKVTPV